MTVGTFSVRGLRRLMPPTGWRAVASVALLALAGCGGGDTVDEFRPQRLLVLGDETSLITDGTSAYPAFLEDGETPHPMAGQIIPAGLKYSVNALDPVAPAPEQVDNPPTGPIDCLRNRIWIQIVADEYNFGFDECNSDPAGTPQRGVIYATVGARVADIADQVTAHRATSSFTPTDLVTVFVGQHDILDVYAGVTAASQCRYETRDDLGSAARTARSLGEALARQINAIARSGDGGRVLFVTVPNQGATPFARQEPTEFNRRECLQELTDAFNAGLRTDVVEDGRQIGLLAIDGQVEQILDNNDRYGFDNANVTDATCKPEAVLPNCTTDTLKYAASNDDYLWADDLHFGPELHDLLGDLVVSRIRNLPF